MVGLVARRLPNSVRVGPQDILISRGYPSGEVFGHYLAGKGEILIADGIEEQYVRETLLHEILHAIWNVAGLGDEGQEEEQVINRMSPLTLDTFTRKENKNVTRFIFGEEW